ncbi:MAG: hypothetical protein IKR26_04360 [Lachnospiraceae bacterium]|nr:hypothetical protein [Lachnospiraceae bacterium]
MAKCKLFKLAGLSALAGAAFVLFKIGDKKLKETGEPERDLQDDFEETDETACETEQGLMGTAKDIIGTAVNGFAYFGKAVKAGFGETAQKAKGAYGEYKEDPEAFKEKAKAKAAETKDKVTGFAAGKFEDVKEFAKEKIDNLRDAEPDEESEEAAPEGATE